MSPTLLEIVVAVILVVVLWQIGLIIAPMIMRRLGGLGRDLDAAADRALADDEPAPPAQPQSKEHSNGTHR